MFNSFNGAGQGQIQPHFVKLIDTIGVLRAIE